MGLFSFLQPKPWLKRNYKEKIFYLPVEYLIKHLDPREKKKVIKHSQDHMEKWQQKKVKKVLEELEKGKRPKDFKPIRLALHEKREQFRIYDGVSRIRAFTIKGIKKIKAEIVVGDW